MLKDFVLWVKWYQIVVHVADQSFTDSANMKGCASITNILECGSSFEIEKCVESGRILRYLFERA